MYLFVDFDDDAVSVISYDCYSVASSTSMSTVVTQIYKPPTECSRPLTVRQKITKRLRAVKKAFKCCIKPDDATDTDC